MPKRLLLCALSLALAACEDKAPPCEGPSCAAPASPFTAADKAVPVALDPNRPQPPSPTHFDVARDEERAPPQDRR